MDLKWFVLFRGSSTVDHHFWIGLYLPEGETSCTCHERSPFDCTACRNKFIWADRTRAVPNFWGVAWDPEASEKCVRLRNPFGGFSAWAGHTCETPLKYICEAGTLSL